MKLVEIELLVSGGESETLELKKTTGELEPAARTLCAFLNGYGGTVIIGVTPGGKMHGQDVSDGTQQGIAATLRKLEPPASVDLQLVRLPGTSKDLIVLHAKPSGDALPYTYDGKPYERIGTSTSVMPQERYQQLLLERLHTRRRWENAPAEGIDLEDLDVDEIVRTARASRVAGRLSGPDVNDPEDILRGLSLRLDGRLLNAAVVLFGRRFLPEYPQCHLRMARFKGIDKTEFLDNRQVHGHGFDLLDEAMLFLQRHLPVAGRIQPGVLERLDIPLFPIEALREALVNALCHRDYSHAGGAVSIAVYDDRLEIWSDGTLPFGLTVDDLKRDHQSRPRNPIIAEAFFRRGLVERWGRGTQRIVELCVQAGHPEPEFIEQAGALGVRFIPSGYIAPYRVGHDLTERQRVILQMLAPTHRLALREVRDRLLDPRAARTVGDDLSHLKKLGLVNSSGHGRGAVWFLVTADHE
ncbi:MAG: putative DNA binding domain-containing protein [Chloroflexota bacterium]|nr:putative DNA binding domain-containing protein [Chloroflexota bacterium]